MLYVVSTPFSIVAKAGGSAEAPENTRAAVTAAMSAPLPEWARLVIELDVRVSRDGAPVVIHDAEVENTTDGRGRVDELDAEELAALRVRANGEPLLFLDAMLELSAPHELVIEAHDADPSRAAPLVRALGRHGQAAQERVIVASEHVRFVHAVRRLEPRLRTAATARAAWAKLLLERVRLERFAPRGHLWIVPVEHRGLAVVTPRFARSAVRAGDPVWAYTVDDANEVARLRSLGVNGCFTTRPAALGAALTSREP